MTATKEREVLSPTFFSHPLQNGAIALRKKENDKNVRTVVSVNSLTVILNTNEL
jgi:hypothetical protein